MFDRASKLEKALLRYPRAPIFARLADHYLRKGRLLRAQVLCEEGCERFPQYATGFFILSRCYERQRMWEEARSALDRGLRVDPDNPAGYRRLSRVYRELGNTTLALKCIERAVALDPLSRTLTDELEQLARLARAQVRSPAQPTVIPEVAPAAEMPAGADGVDVAASAVTPSGDVGIFDDDGLGDADVAVLADAPAASLDANAESLSAQPPPGAGPAEAEAESVEPFGALQSLPEWETDAEGGPESAGAGIGERPREPSRDEAASAEPAARPAATAGSDEVAALGAGLFDDDVPEVRAETDPGVRGAQPQTAAGGPVVRPVPQLSTVSTGRREPPRPPLPTEPPGRVLPPAESAPEPRAETLVARFASRDEGLLIDLLRQIDPVPAVAGADPEPADDADVGPVPTVTLAELYRTQGFPERAFQIYRRVLDADPDNEAARQGAAMLGDTRSEPRK